MLRILKPAEKVGFNIYEICGIICELFFDKEFYMNKSSNVIVVGLQLVGAAAIWSLAKKGVKVIGFDKNVPPHNSGSSHGDSRIYRQAIGEGDFYTPYALRSCELFRELEADTGLEILTQNGGLIMVSENDNSPIHGNADFIGETRRTAEKYKIPGHQVLSTAEIHRRFPQFNLVGDELGYYEPTAGFLRPENAIRAELELATKLGAEIHTGEEVLDIFSIADGIKVRTSKGDYYSDKVVLSMGSWISRFLPSELKPLFKTHRQILFWFDILNNYSSFLPEVFPVFLWQRDKKFIYGFPAINGPEGGLKIASETLDEVNPDFFNRNVSILDIRSFYNSQVRGYFPDLSPACLRAVVCKYTNTPDKHFIVDTYPGHKDITIASPCSGHGAKHSSAIGEAVAELVVDGNTKLDISHFSFNRFKI